MTTFRIHHEIEGRGFPPALVSAETPKLAEQELRRRLGPVEGLIIHKIKRDRAIDTPRATGKAARARA